MEFKGIAWAGNIYQKFEDMCLEVEEAIYEDTVKYVENQVQKVGFSVKKFCSAVTEDLIPPSCVYPVNLSSGDLSLNTYGDIDVIKKPIPRIFDTHQTKENKDRAISNPTAEKESSLNGCCDINSLLVPSKPRAPIIKKVGVTKKTIGIRRISRNNHPSNDNCKSSTSGDRIERASCDKKLVSTSELDVRGESEEVVGNTPIPDPGLKSPASIKILSAVSARQKEDDQEFASHASEKPSSAESAAIERISRNNHPSKDYCRTNSTSGDRIELASCDKKFISTLDLDVRRESEEASGKTPNPDAGFESRDSLKSLSAVSARQKEDEHDFVSPASGIPSSAESVRQSKDNLDSVSPAFEKNLLAEPERLKGDPGSTSSCSGVPSESTGTSASGVSFSMLGSSIRSNTSNRESEGEVVMTSDEGTSMKDGSSNFSATLRVAESCDKEILKSDEDVFDMKIIEEYEFAPPRFENIKREKLDESCVMVEEDELHSLPQGTKKHMSYKKKIREALSLKLRSRKDILHKGSVGKSNNEVVKEKGPGRDSLESGWEFL